MDFFQAQDHARRNTGRMVFLFLLAVLFLIALTNLLVMGTMGYLSTAQEIDLQQPWLRFDWEIFGLTSIGVVIVVLLGSLYKTAQLSSGGQGIAESLGGTLIDQNTTNPAYRVVLNVIEEMAIASGTPVPPVYILEHEQGINAFAAGFSPSDAVIGVTRGCIEHLNREEFQGVMAHEFSHILNGDMRLNIRLIGVLHGILVIGLIGYFILRSASYSSGRRNQGGGAILALGAGLMAIGFGGTFFGNLIKSYVSRQREYLADASAVQFTRSSTGIAGALSKISFASYGSNLDNPVAAEISHTFFSNAISSFVASLFSTHPSLQERVHRINPRYDDPTGLIDQDDSITKKFLPQHAAATAPEKSKATAAGIVAAGAMADALGVIHQTGRPGSEHLGYAKQIIGEIPGAILQAAHEPYGARAVIYALLIDPEPSIQDLQLSHLQQFGDTGIHPLTLKLLPVVRSIERSIYLPLIDICLGALRQLSTTQYQQFKTNLTALIEADKKIQLFEWALRKIVFHHLDRAVSKVKQPAPKFSSIIELESETALLLSFLAHAEHKSADDAEHAFTTAIVALPSALHGVALIDRKVIDLNKLNEALDRLALLRPLIKPIILKACATCIRADGKISVAEVELLRAIAAILDCPMPPVIFNLE